MTRGIVKDLVGSTFGHLEVLKRAGSDKQGNAKWLCRCGCGNEVEVRGSFLSKGQVCCGRQCRLNPRTKVKDIAGKRFGELVAIEHTGFTKTRKSVWKFRCSCGVVVEVPSDRVLNSGMRSCGKGIHASSYKHGQSGTRGYKSHHFAKYAATKKNRTPRWLSQDDVNRIAEMYDTASRLTRERGELFEVDHFYPLQGKTVSGLHVPDNLQIVHRSQNRRKSNLHPDDVC